jgi:hypothetical protein
MPITLLTLTPPDAEWMNRDLPCRLTPLLMDAEHKDDIEQAREVCAACPVLRRCREWTLSLPPSKDVAGVAGGLTAEERHKARRRIRRSRPSSQPPKACKRCGETKPAGDFYPHPHGDGREAQCIACRRELGRIYKAAKRAAAKQAAGVAS